MDRHAMTRREMIGMGLGAAAGMILLPSVSMARGVATPFLSLHAAPLDGVDAAIKAARWIHQFRIETQNGVTWPTEPGNAQSVGLDLYNGTPGVILFHLELYYATKDSSWLDEAQLGANELITKLPELQAAKRAGLYDGLSGVGFVLKEVHKATNDSRYGDAAMSALRMVQGLAQTTPDSAQWTGPSATTDIISGSAGIGSFLIWSATEMDDIPSRAMALLTGKQLFTLGVPDKGGMKWPIHPGDTTFYPNFAHGTAGVGFFFARLFAGLFDRSMYSGALQATRYLDAIATQDAKSYKVYEHEPGGETQFDMGWANGPAGTSRLFSQLGEMARTDHWHGMADKCGQAMLDSGIPGQPLPGEGATGVNAVDQATGLAGIGECLIRLQNITPKPEYGDMVQRVAANLVAQGTPDGDGLKWAPKPAGSGARSSEAQTGFMQGAAGIGTFLLHADGLAKGLGLPIKWPDAPTTASCKAGTAKIRDMSDMPGGGPKPRC